MEKKRGGGNKKKKNANRMHCCLNRTKGSLEKGYIKQLSQITGAETQPLIYLFKDYTNALVILCVIAAEVPRSSLWPIPALHKLLIVLVPFSIV